MGSGSDDPCTVRGYDVAGAACSATNGPSCLGQQRVLHALRIIRKSAAPVCPPADCKAEVHNVSEAVCF